MPDRGAPPASVSAMVKLNHASGTSVALTELPATTALLSSSVPWRTTSVVTLVLTCGPSATCTVAEFVTTPLVVPPGLASALTCTLKLTWPDWPAGTFSSVHTTAVASSLSAPPSDALPST